MAKVLNNKQVKLAMKAIADGLTKRQAASSWHMKREDLVTCIYKYMTKNSPQKLDFN
jgi:hypothetical protein